MSKTTATEEKVEHKSKTDNTKLRTAIDKERTDDTSDRFSDPDSYEDDRAIPRFVKSKKIQHTEEPSDYDPLYDRGSRRMRRRSRGRGRRRRSRSRSRHRRH